MPVPKTAAPTPPSVEALKQVAQLPSDCSAVNAYSWDTHVAYAVCMAESGGNPNAHGANTNGTDDAGLMQVNSLHVDSGLIGDQERFNPQANIKAAWAIYQGGGWKAWSAFNNGSYKKYL